MGREKLLETLKEYKTSSNKDLLEALEILSEDFEKTKKVVMDLSKDLDVIENSYNLILKEYNTRTGKK